MQRTKPALRIALTLVAALCLVPVANAGTPVVDGFADIFGYCDQGPIVHAVCWDWKSGDYCLLFSYDCLVD